MRGETSVLKYIGAFILPAFVLIIALYYLLRKPSPDNKMLGYRTVRSMKSPEAWKRAQYIYGRQLLIGGIVAAVFGCGFLSVSSLFLKVLMIILEPCAITFFGMMTEFILCKELGE